MNAIEDCKALIMQNLARIPEPCSLAMRSPTDIVRMGLIDDVEITDGHVKITLCLTDTACVHFRSMQAYIRDVLLPIENIDSVEVVQTTQKLWTPDRAS